MIVLSRLRSRHVASACVALAGVVAGCSGPRSPSFQSGSDPSGAAGPVGSSGFSVGNGDQGGTFSSSDAGVGAGAFGAACSYSVSKAEQKSLDVYIMLDQSLSMLDQGKWTGATGAIGAFVHQPLSGVSVGIQYFALDLVSCTASDYAKPEIEIALLPGVADQITKSLSNHIPSTVTPTVAALQGAIDHGVAWASAHPADQTVVVLATDGDPDTCDILPDPLTPVEKVAQMGVQGTPSIPTFVIGVGTETANLDAIAKAGGTGSAFIVDTAGNVNTQFLAALNKIRGTAIGCQFKIPAPTNGGVVDFSKVNVQFSAPGSAPELVGQVSDAAHCPQAGNAWYYDNSAAPTQILLCGSTCGTVSAGGEVDVLTGCRTVTAR